MSLIDRALQKAYQQRCYDQLHRQESPKEIVNTLEANCLSGSVRSADIAMKMDELYVHSPDVPLRPHIQPPRSLDLPAPSLGSRGRSKQVESPSPLNLLSATSSPSIRSESVQRNFEATIDALSQVDNHDRLRKSDHQTELTLLSFPSLNAIAGAKISEDRESSNQRFDQKNTFTAAWEVDSFLMPWVCQQAQRHLTHAIYRAIQELMDCKPGIIWVSSLLPGEGRTSIATLLASTMARSSQNVILIQGESKPISLARHLGVASEVGWNAVHSSGTATQLADVCVHSLGDKFTVLPADPTYSFSNADSMQHVSRMVPILCNHFDTVIVDGPPGQHPRNSSVSSIREAEILIQDVRRTSTQAIEQYLAASQVDDPRSLRVVQNFTDAKRAGK